MRPEGCFCLGVGGWGSGDPGGVGSWGAGPLAPGIPCVSIRRSGGWPGSGDLGENNDLGESARQHWE